MSVCLFIAGKPVPKKRPRVMRGRAYTPRETLEYENRVAWEARQSKITFLPKQKLHVGIDFYLHNRGYQLTDVDNLVKSALDGIVSGGMFNDRDVDSVLARKHVCEGDQERTEIIITPLRTDRPGK